jgi:hypothetical protein
MDDRRVRLMLAQAAAHRSEAARLEAEVDAVLAARVAGVSPWGSELPPLAPAEGAGAAAVGACRMRCHAGGVLLVE